MARKDATDHLCERWAKTRRELLGLARPRFASEYLGAMRSTLGGVKDYADGSSGPIRQHYPEVYPEEMLPVNRAFWKLSPALKDVMDLHYGCTGPTHVKWKVLGLSRSMYFERVARVKSFIEGYLAQHDTRQGPDLTSKRSPDRICRVVRTMGLVVD